jgi:hypothetical protein
MGEVGPTGPTGPTGSSLRLSASDFFYNNFSDPYRLYISSSPYDFTPGMQVTVARPSTNTIMSGRVHSYSSGTLSILPDPNQPVVGGPVGSLEINVAGVPGVTGPTGPSGNDGVPGLTGPPGNDGAPGADGAAGADGLTGPTGPQGPAGVTNIKTWVNNGTDYLAGGMRVDISNYVSGFTSYPAIIYVSGQDLNGGIIDDWINSLDALTPLSPILTLSDTSSNSIIGILTNASLYEGSYALSVTITSQTEVWDTASFSATTGLNTSISLAIPGPQGSTGADGADGAVGQTGPTGPAGEIGLTGNSFRIIGSVATSEDIPTLISNPLPGDSAITTDTGNLWSYNPGLVGSILFNQDIESQYLSIPSSNDFDFGTNSFTIEGWYYITDYQSLAHSYLWDASPNPFANAFFFSKIDPTGVVVQHWNDDPTSGSQLNFIATVSTIPLNTWTHICTMRSGNNIAIFVNGVCQASGTCLNSNNSETSCLIGSTTSYRIGASTANNAGLNGNISNFRIVGRTTVYSFGTTVGETYFTVPTSALTNVPNTALLLATPNSDDFYLDTSSNTLAVLNNGTLSSTDGPGLYNTDYSFKNVGQIVGSTGPTGPIGPSGAGSTATWLNSGIDINSGEMRVDTTNYVDGFPYPVTIYVNGIDVNGVSTVEWINNLSAMVSLSPKIIASDASGNSFVGILTGVNLYEGSWAISISMVSQTEVWNLVSAAVMTAVNTTLSVFLNGDIGNTGPTGPTGPQGSSIIKTWVNNGDASVVGGMTIEKSAWVFNFSSYPATIRVNSSDVDGADVGTWISTLNSLITLSPIMSVSDNLGNSFVGDFISAAASGEGLYDIVVAITSQTAVWNTTSEVITGAQTSLCVLLRGPTGADGAEGAPGQNGNDGAPGAEGAQGPPGNDGAPGEQGPPGNDGAPGEQGPPGNDGAPGEQGPSGNDGSAGATGATGPTGPAGTSTSTTWLNSGVDIVSGGMRVDTTNYVDGFPYPVTISVNAIDVDGISAEPWLTTLSGMIPLAPKIIASDAYGNSFIGTLTGAYLSEGYWVISISMLSQTPVWDTVSSAVMTGVNTTLSVFLNGETGATGPTGATGNDGAPGADGVTGATGNDGATGATGPTGPNGVNIIETWSNFGSELVSGGIRIDTSNYVSSFTSYPAIIYVNENNINGANVATWINVLNSLVSLIPRLSVIDTYGNSIICEYVSSSQSGSTYALTVSILSQSAIWDTTSMVVTEANTSICALLVGPQGVPGADGTPGAPGAPGMNGMDGAQGQNGNDGMPGAPGSPGADGPAGADGPPGATGSTGPAGMGFNPVVATGNTISTGLTPGTYTFSSTLFLGYQTRNAPWAEGQYIYLSDNTLFSTIVYYGTLGYVTMGVDGLVGFYLSQINSVSGSPAEGQIDSNDWTMSYAPVPGSVITRTVISSATYSVQPFDTLLGVTYTATGTVQINLPLANAYINKFLHIVDEGGNATVNNITIVAGEDEFILGSATHVMNTSYGSATLYSNGESPGRWFFV